MECDEEYLGEPARRFGERLRNILSPFPIVTILLPHVVLHVDNFSIVGKKEQNFVIKEAIFIKFNGPSLNRNIGKYHLPHIWDEVLFNASELKLK